MSALGQNGNCLVPGNTVVACPNRMMHREVIVQRWIRNVVCPRFLLPVSGRRPCFDAAEAALTNPTGSRHSAPRQFMFNDLRPGVPVFSFAFVHLDSIPRFIQTSKIVRCIRIASSGRLQVPLKCLLWISCNTLSLLITQSNRVLSVNDSPRRGLKLERETLFFVFRDTSTLAIALS